MTLSIRTPAKLLSATTDEVLAGGIAIIWGDPQVWGGIFDAQEQGDQLRAIIGKQPVTASLQTADGRTKTVTLALSEFIADGVRPITFSGRGQLDTADFKAYTDVSGQRR